MPANCFELVVRGVAVTECGVIEETEPLPKPPSVSGGLQLEFGGEIIVAMLKQPAFIPILSAPISPKLGIPASAFGFGFRLVGGKLEGNFQALIVDATATIITSLVTKSRLQALPKGASL